MTGADITKFTKTTAEPNFENLLKVLRREKPDRPTLFEFFLNWNIEEEMGGKDTAALDSSRPFHQQRRLVNAFHNAGYDYATIPPCDYKFKSNTVAQEATRSLNDGAVFTDRTSFEQYTWPEPDDANYGPLEFVSTIMPEGMKAIANGPGGVLENVIAMTGFDDLCYLTVDDPDLVAEIFEAVGSRLVRYYELCGRYDVVGAMVSNDDWGFKTQTMLDPASMKHYVFPWHKKIVETIHGLGRPVILHSCGQLETVMDGIIDELGYDGKHSYEDTILPVEDAYERWGSRIAILGGMDVDFMCRATPETIYKRSKAMFERSADRGGYALGTGNSVAAYVPSENYYAMIRAALEQR